ncbi:MAG: hypothetical protein WCD70_05730, partial [Alphaproteobacteria bacterium]
MGRGLFTVAGLLLIGTLRAIWGGTGSSYPRRPSSGVIALFATISLPWLKLINGYEVLALCLLVQLPLAFLPSKPNSTFSERSKEGNKRITTWHGREIKPLLVGPFAFLGRVFLIALLGAFLIYMDGASNGEIGTWAARIGYLTLTFAWLMNVQGRFEDAGLVGGWRGSQYALVVSVASLMPLAVHWVNGYRALATFALIQIPTIF